MPWADVLYACDGDWWKQRQGVPQFKGVKLTPDRWAATELPGVHKVTVVRRCNEILMGAKGLLGSGGNSGFQALNLALQFGARRIALVGFDMRLDYGAHWHGRHPHRNPEQANIVKWRSRLDAVAGRLQRLGAEVVNCSPISALQAYPRMSLPDLLSSWRECGD